MSNPVVQIKRASFSAPPNGAGYFHLGTLSYGELGYWHQYSGNRHYLFIGDSGSNAILLNPRYSFSLSGTNETSGYRLTYQLTKDNITPDTPGDPISQSVVSASNFVIPIANEENAVGLITNDTQTIAGNKTFTGAILPQTNNSNSIGQQNKVWGNIYATNFHGNATSATKLANKRTINGTEFDGTENIVTATWGAETNITISPTADTNAHTGTTTSGGSPFSLRIPATMDGFSEITSTNLTANYIAPLASASSSMLGATGRIWDDLLVKNVNVYNPNKTFYTRLISDAASNNSTLTLPETGGELVSHTDNVAIGSTSAPVYVAASGSVTECNIIDVAHGGTGVNSIAVGSIIIGNGTNATTTVPAVEKGRLLVSNGTSTAPIYATPTLDWNAGTSNGPALKFTINSTDYTSTAIPSASGSASGIVTTGAQTFGGAKTFSGNVIINNTNTLSVGGKITASAGIDVTGDIKISNGKIKSSPNSSSTITFSDSAISMVSTKIGLDGKIILTNDSYGTSLPTSGMEEGQIFFLIS